MNTLKRLTLAICIILLMNACAPLRAPVVVKNSPIEMFKYAYISPTKGINVQYGEAPTEDSMESADHRRPKASTPAMSLQEY